MRKIIIAAALLAATAVAAQAQGRFVHPADANKDGAVTGPEFVDWNTKQAGGPGR